MKVGLAHLDAAFDAARLRFRPILMTSLAFLLGVLPLVYASGAGSASRRALGTTVFGAQRNLFRSELDLAALTRRELAAVVELYRALGGGWTPDADPNAAAGRTPDE